jgi:hypothetical protein
MEYHDLQSKTHKNILTVCQPFHWNPLLVRPGKTFIIPYERVGVLKELIPH